MNNALQSRLALGILGICLMVFSGCASTPPSRFYILHSLAAPESSSQHETHTQAIAIGLGPVKVPDYMDRPQIVTRTSQNELKLADFDRWASLPREDVARVMGENLASLLNTDRIYYYPWMPNTPLDYSIAVEVIRFDGTPGGNVVLHAQWTIWEDGGKKILTTRSSAVEEQTGAESYEALVAAMSRAVAALSRDIAGAISAPSR
jgi:uncharacterized lipoprotein YmbA